MVSVPDWARFAHMLDNKPTNPSSQSRYHRQREEEVIRQAEEHGYFLTPSKSFLEDNFAPDEGPRSRQSIYRTFMENDKKARDLNQVFLIKLTHSHVRSPGDIGMCNNLTICTLSNNYITKFDALANCVNLMKLDLHSNQIATLPGTSFWSNMDYLRILLLHDNPIGKIDNLHYLSVCPMLTALTLNDTPLSLKRNYRHHVVNSIWSLKALDNMVISDEEIIEDADFGHRFVTMHPSFFVDLCPQTPQDSQFEQEVDVVMKTLAQINLIMAHNSPVLIIQKYIRGYLARKGTKFVQDMRIWAAVTIQRKYRTYKGWGSNGDIRAPPPPTSPTYGMAGQPPSTIDSMKIDYDTYMRNRRPGSTGISETSISSRNVGPQVSGEDLLSESPDGKKRKNIFINLTKLQTGTLQSLQDEAIAMDTILPTEGTFHEERTPKQSLRKIRKRREPERKKRAIKSIKHFFGPVVETVMSPEPGSDTDNLMIDGEEIPVVHFRLRGMKQEVQVIDPTAELILSRQEAGHEVRLAEADYHRKMDSMPKPKIERKKVPNSEKRIFSKIQGNMGLSCLRAVQQAYRDRELAEKQTARMEFVLNIKDQREAAKERIKMFQDERRNFALKNRDKEQKQMLEMFERKEYVNRSVLERSNEKRSRSSHWSKQRRGEYTFMSDFNVQNTSVSNALMRHDRQAQLEDKRQGKAMLVKSHKDVEMEQQDMVRRYMEHRQLMRQTESAMQRAALDTKMLQEANERLMTAKQRVAQQKARVAIVSACTTPVPPVTTQSLPPVSQTKYKAAQVM